MLVLAQQASFISHTFIIIIFVTIKSSQLFANVAGTGASCYFGLEPKYRIHPTPAPASTHSLSMESACKLTILEKPNAPKRMTAEIEYILMSAFTNRGITVKTCCMTLAIGSMVRTLHYYEVLWKNVIIAVFDFSLICSLTMKHSFQFSALVHVVIYKKV